MSVLSSCEYSVFSKFLSIFVSKNTNDKLHPIELCIITFIPDKFSIETVWYVISKLHEAVFPKTLNWTSALEYHIYDNGGHSKV